MKNRFHFFFLAVFATSVALPQNKRIAVPLDYPTIQGAVNAAADGDTVLVSPGVYVENLRVFKKIVLSSLYLLDKDTSYISATVIDGSNPTHPDSGSVVLFGAGADTGSVLTGFTIRGGSGTKVPDYVAGGGILCMGGGATITRNVITENILTRSMTSGAGISIWDGAPHVIIHSNIITRNKSLGPVAGEGGGISSGSSCDIRNNIIARNTGTNAGGAALTLWPTGKVVRVVNNTIAFNEQHGGVEGVFIYDGLVYFLNNVIWNPGDGAELMRYFGSLHASNNLIRGSYYGENNFSMDPEFGDSVQLTLSPASPAISAGVESKTMNSLLVESDSLDLYGRPRPGPDGSFPDLGAIESPTMNPTPPSRDAQMVLRTMTAAGYQRRYILFTPKDYASLQKCRLVFFLHGTPANCDWSVGTGFTQLADSRGEIVVYPDSYTGSWATSASSYDMVFLNQLLDTLIDKYKVDTNNILMSGFSSGAGMCYWFAHYHSNRISAIAPISMTISRELDSLPVPIPMISFMGTSDPNVSYNGSSTHYGAEEGAAIWAGFNGCNPTPTEVQLPDIDPSDGSTVSRFSYFKPGGPQPRVVFYRINGGRHSIPGPQQFQNRPINRDVNAAELIADFFGLISEVEEAAQEIPVSWELKQNYPNPFNPTTTISFTVPTSMPVHLAVFDLLGREVAILVDEKKTPGDYQVKFDASTLASGVFFYQLTAGNFAQTRKMIIVK